MERPPNNPDLVSHALNDPTNKPSSNYAEAFKKKDEDVVAVRITVETAIRDEAEMQEFLAQILEACVQFEKHYGKHLKKKHKSIKKRLDESQANSNN